MRLPTILALGGGGFTSEEGDPALDDLVLDLCAARVPRVLFLPTASGDPAMQIGRFHAAFGDRLCEPDVLSLFRLGREPRPLAEVVLRQDVIYVGGGSMRNLLAIWRVHGLDELLRVAWREGVVLAGLSAGAMCWFNGGVTTSTGRPEPSPGLGFLPGSLSVHGDREPARRPVYLTAVRDGLLPPGWMLDDGAGLLFRGAMLDRVVSAREHAGVAFVERDGLLPLATEPLRPRRPDLLSTTATADVRELRALRTAAASRGVGR